MCTDASHSYLVRAAAALTSKRHVSCSARRPFAPSLLKNAICPAGPALEKDGGGDAHLRHHLYYRFYPASILLGPRRRSRRHWLIHRPVLRGQMGWRPHGVRRHVPARVHCPHHRRHRGHRHLHWLDRGGEYNGRHPPRPTIRARRGAGGRYGRAGPAGCRELDRCDLLARHHPMRHLRFPRAAPDNLLVPGKVRHHGVPGAQMKPAVEA